MSHATKIEWTSTTWNPIRGCSKVSAGCANCYAEKVAARFSGHGMPYEGLVTNGRWNGTVRTVPEHLADPLRWRKPRRVFVNSMSDLFHESMTDEQIAAVLGVMAAAPQHTFQVLTKRAERMRAFFAQGDTVATFLGAATRAGVAILREPDEWKRQRPLPNVHLGVSVEDQRAADERIPLLLDTPAAVRWISAEPLLGPLDLWRVRDGSWYDREGADFYNALTGSSFWRNGDHGIGGGPRLDWVVVGGESGPGARPCDVAWIRSIVAQCRDAGVPAFVKQLGARPVDSVIRWVDPESMALGTIHHPKGGDPSEWPADLRVREFPK